MKPTIQSLDHLVLTVADVDATCVFYQRVLGVEVATFRGDRKALIFGSQKINLHPVGSEIDPRADRPTPGSGDLCFLTQTPIGEVQRHLESCGVSILLPPTERTGATGSILSLYFRDPDGNLIEVANRID